MSNWSRYLAVFYMMLDVSIPKEFFLNDATLFRFRRICLDKERSCIGLKKYNLYIDIS